MTEKDIGKLMKASEISAKEQLPHIVIMLSQDGQFVVTGSNNFISAVTDTEELTKLKEILFQNKEGPVSPAQILEFPLLPCSPYSAAWNKGGAVLARSVLTRMLDRIGYGGGGRKKKLGVGNPPFGWPANHPWKKFVGVTRSGLSFNEVTGIIISMLVASNVDPNTHVKKEEIVEEEPNIIPEQNTEDTQPANIHKPIIGQNIGDLAQQNIGDLAEQNIGELAQQNIGDLAEQNIGDLAQQNIGDLAEQNIGDLAEQNIGDLAMQDIWDLAEQNIGDLDEQNIGNLAEQTIWDLAEQNVGDLAEQNIGDLAKQNIGDLADQNIGDRAEQKIRELAEQYIGNQQVLIQEVPIEGQNKCITEEITRTIPSIIYVEQKNLVTTHESNVEFEIGENTIEVPIDNREQKLDNNWVNMGDETVKRRKFGS